MRCSARGTWHWAGGYEFSFTFEAGEMTFTGPDGSGTISYAEVADNQELVGRFTAHHDSTQVGNYHKIVWTSPDVDEDIMAGTDYTFLVIYRPADSVADAWDTTLIFEESQLGFYTRAANPPPNDMYVINMILDGATHLEPGDYNIVFERDLAGGTPSTFTAPRNDAGLEQNGDFQGIVPFNGRTDLIEGRDNTFTIWRDDDKDGVLDAGEYYSRVTQTWGTAWEGTNVVFDTWQFAD